MQITLLPYMPVGITSFPSVAYTQPIFSYLEFTNGNTTYLTNVSFLSHPIQTAELPVGEPAVLVECSAGGRHQSAQISRPHLARNAADNGRTVRPRDHPQCLREECPQTAGHLSDQLRR